MLLENYKKRFIRYNKLYFSEKIIYTNADIIKYIQYSNSNYTYLDSFFTLIIDLNNSEEEIRRNIRTNYIHRINQAVKIHAIKVEYYNKPDISELNTFVKRYNKISEDKGYSKIKIEDLLRIKDNIVISYALYNYKIICGHLYIYDQQRFRQLNSYIENYLDGFPISKISSKANKYLHYKDILYAKKKKFLIFDFGGIFNVDSRTVGITIFKLGFSKKIESSCNLTIANTFRGKIVLFILKYVRFSSISRLLYLANIFFKDYILRSNFYYSKLQPNIIINNYSNEAYQDFFNLRDINKYIEYENGDKIIFFGVNNGSLFYFCKRLKGKFFTIIENNLDKFIYYSSELKKIKSDNIKLLYYKDTEINNLFFKYIFINNKNINLQELRVLLSTIKANNNNERYYIIYFYPIYNHVFKEFNLKLLNDVESVSFSRVHIYCNV